ncbi:MAG: hypothetical protein HYY17_10000 [Planctomycetes bacterium]|nr:hypothetical protein [Planctomycetota bacterium]
MTDQMVLEFANEHGWGGTGRAYGVILDIMRERGVAKEDVDTSIEILKKKGHIKFEHFPPGRDPLGFMNTVVAITTEGKDQLRRLRAALQFNLRLPEALRQEISEFVGKAGDSAGGVAVTAIREWVRMQKFPAIDFRWSPSGRQPFVMGTGLTAWEVYRVWLDHGEDPDKIERNYANLSGPAGRARVNAAVAYARAFLKEMPEGAFGKRPPFAREVKV